MRYMLARAGRLHAPHTPKLMVILVLELYFIEIYTGVLACVERHTLVLCLPALVLSKTENSSRSRLFA